MDNRLFLCGIHPSPCKENAGQGSFGVLKTSFSILKTSFSSFLEGFPLFMLKSYKILPFSKNFVNKDRIKRVTPLKFFSIILHRM